MGSMLNNSLHDGVIREKDGLSRKVRSTLYVVPSPPHPLAPSHPYQATDQLHSSAHFTLALHQYKHRCMMEITIKGPKSLINQMVACYPIMSEQADLKGFWPYWREARSQEGRP